MTITYRTQKGAPLTWQEVDENFFTLATGYAGATEAAAQAVAAAGQASNDAATATGAAASSTAAAGAATTAANDAAAAASAAANLVAVFGTNAGAANVGAAGGITVQQGLDSKVGLTPLAAVATVPMLGYSAADAQKVFDGGYSLEDYTALRAYTGRARTLRITGPYAGRAAPYAPAPYAGVFTRADDDITSEDDYCTCIVDILGRRWKRQFDKSHVSVGWVVGLPDGVAVNTAIAVAAYYGISLVTVPKKAYSFLPGETIGIPANMTLRGDVPGPFDGYGINPMVTVIAATFGVTNTTTEFITLQGNSSKIEDILFYYPNQVAPTAAAPIAYPYTIISAIGGGGTRISRCTAVNAYNFIYIRSGRSKVEDIISGAFRNDLQIDEVLDWVEVSNFKCQCMWDAFAGLPHPQNIDAWVMGSSGGIALHTRRIDSLVANNFSVFGRYIGHLFEDSANVALVPRNGYGRLSNVDFDYVVYGVYGVSSNPTAIGFQYTNVTIGANGSGVGLPGQWAFGTVAGGTGAPTITVTGGAMRGTWAVGLTGCPVPPPAGRIYIENMRGLNPMTSAKTPAPAVPASNTPVTNNYPSPVRIAIVGGTMTNILINGAGAGSVPGMYILYPGETIAIVYSVAPTWAWHGL